MSQDTEKMPEHMQDHMEKMRKMHFKNLWTHFTNIMMGVWLLSFPFSVGSFQVSQFSDAVWHVTSDRDLWEPAFRSSLLGWSDIVSGLLIMLFGGLSLSRRFLWAQWANCAVGIWLLFAPLVFWSPSAAVYNNDTLVGAFVIAFSVLVPMMPGMSHKSMIDQSDLPKGWSYNPSSFTQRAPIIALGLFGFVIARILAAYQMGHIDHLWDPFFSGREGLNGSETIVTSDVSKAWPIPDGGLGAITYMFEILMGIMGDRRRWRTMPWMVAGFGVAVVPLGIVSIYFIVIQPIIIGTWCTLCLVTAFAMVIMIPYSLDELVVMGQYLVQAVRRGQSFWKVFFKGGAAPDAGLDEAHKGFEAGFIPALKEGVLGNPIPPTLLISAALGIFLMFTRLVFDTVPPLANSDHLIGALIFTFAVMAFAEVGRALRLVNILFGLWLIGAPWLMEGGSLTASIADNVIGIAIIGLSLPRGKLSGERYGGWERFIV